MNKKSEYIKRIKIVASDVDGVLTDGSLYVGSDGVEYKKFHVEDHAGIALCYFGGINTGFLSARFSETTSIRAKEMKVIANLYCIVCVTLCFIIYISFYLLIPMK